MITVIAKRIDNGEPEGGQSAYAQDLLAYMTNPEREKEPGAAQARREEKCVAVLCRNFSKPVMLAGEMAAEMAADCSLSMRLRSAKGKSQGIDHWVMSLKATAGETPSADELMKAADTWIESMGYGGDAHKWCAAIHADTGNLHIHLAVCRVNGLTGKVKPRGWWKNDNQKALAIVASKCGWSLEAGSDRYRCPANARPEVVKEIDPITHVEQVSFRPKVVETGKDGERDYHPGDKAERLEHYAGIRSDKRILHDRLTEAYESIKDDLHHMKWGQIHIQLARRGIQMERREYEGKSGDVRYGLVFSIDGENWQAASAVCPEMSWNRLNGHIGAKANSWRKANADAVRELDEARTVMGQADFDEEPDEDIWEDGTLEAADLAEDVRDVLSGAVPTEKIEKRIAAMLSKEEVQALREIPIDEVRMKLKDAGYELGNPDKKSRNAIDVLVYELRMPYAQAVEKLAELFPSAHDEAVKSGIDLNLSTYKAAIEEGKKQAARDGKSFPEYEPGEFGYNAGREIVKWFNALQLYRIDIHTSITKAARDAGVTAYGFNSKDMSVYDVLRSMPSLMNVAAKGKVDAPVTLYCAPKWHEGRIGIMLDDVRDEGFLEKYPPTAVVATSDRKPQAFWVMDQKYPEKEFYDNFMAWLNEQAGDPKVVRQGWDTRLAGFYNTKRFMQDGSGRVPIVHVKSSTRRRPVEMEALVDEYRIQWEKRRDELELIQAAREDAKKEEAKKKEAAKIKAASADPKTDAEEAKEFSVEAESPRRFANGLTFKKFMAALKKVVVPDWLVETGLRCQAYVKAQGEAKHPYADRSRVDAETARLLYVAGAYPDEVYSFFLAHACQDETPVNRPYGEARGGGMHMAIRVQDKADKDRKARYVTANMAPPDMVTDGWRSKHPEREKDVARIYGFTIPRDDPAYRRRMEEIRERQTEMLEHLAEGEAL